MSNIEPGVQSGVTVRMDELLPAIRVEGRTRVQGHQINADPFKASRTLGRRITEMEEGWATTTLDAHSSHTVPAPESLLAAYLLIGYELARKNSCFFFQAEDGIRDLTVTGVQTCALPI